MERDRRNHNLILDPIRHYITRLQKLYSLSAFAWEMFLLRLLCGWGVSSSWFDFPVLMIHAYFYPFALILGKSKYGRTSVLISRETLSICWGPLVLDLGLPACEMSSSLSPFAYLTKPRDSTILSKKAEREARQSPWEEGRNCWWNWFNKPRFTSQNERLVVVVVVMRLCLLPHPSSLTHA